MRKYVMLVLRTSKEWLRSHHTAGKGMAGEAKEKAGVNIGVK